jgi:CheY-like chemotaxis protein
MAEATISLEPKVDEPPSTLRVLVVEDDPRFRRILQSWLQSWSHEVVVVENDARAWDILQQEQPPELLILDWMMPEVDGTELCRRIRAQDALAINTFCWSPARTTARMLSADSTLAPMTT